MRQKCDGLNEYDSISSKINDSIWLKNDKTSRLIVPVDERQSEGLKGAMVEMTVEWFRSEYCSFVPVTNYNVQFNFDNQ